MKIFVKQLNPMGSMSLRPLLILFSIYQTNEFISIYTYSNFIVNDDVS